ncbi:leukocyte antigen CD37 [Callorhinchus milii]|uniref:Tetraspanin n=1 Tax=Callorhinchus milii TaxID=7868 RepID=V9L8P7_CALMI|nr:leukocyte antigen CD37 [Callorhinchus milii]XP_042201046.1 leukocyte antigen CD37 [Callorhinchus milii]|eukprot:gi/632984218/ref/XP_007909031.1/ PREDICTED: leukocyte antigen CD37 [Callorhinchus milii]
MVSKGCIVVTKYLLFVFNLIFFFLGGLMLGFGLWILLDENSFMTVLKTVSIPVNLWSYVLSGLGTFTMMMGFLGCLGALKEVRCMLGFYFAFLVFLLASQVTIGVLIVTQRKVLTKELESRVRKVIEKYNDTDSSSKNLEHSWDFVQYTLACCGWNSSQEWFKNKHLQLSTKNHTFPCSCSLALKGNFTGFSNRPHGFCSVSTDSHPLNGEVTGCKAQIYNWLVKNLFSIVAICIGISLIEVLGMVFAMYLFRNFDRDYNKLIRYH